jgi:NifU-like protein
MVDKSKDFCVTKCKKTKKECSVDGFSKQGCPWFYSETVKQHFFNPRNIFRTSEEVEKYHADGIGNVGSPACGDGMKMFIQVDDVEERIKDVRWQTYGCATAIASTSAFSVMLTKEGGLKIQDALKIKPKDIADYLGGLPARKFHCSVLADQAFRAAVKDYFIKKENIKRWNELCGGENNG